MVVDSSPLAVDRRPKTKDKRQKTSERTVSVGLLLSAKGTRG